GKVVASSFVASGEGDSAREDVERAKELAQGVFRPGSVATAALGGDKPSEVFPVQLRGEEFVAVVAPLPGNAISKTAGVILLKSLSQAQKPSIQAGVAVLVF